MIVIDVNLLLYAYDEASPFYASAQTWLEGCFSGTEHIGLTWPTICGFLRISTNSNVRGERFSMPEALAVVASWLEQSNVQILAPGRKHWERLRNTIEEGQVRGPLVSDAELAALTMEHGGTLYTTDRDFARFPGLRWTNPLVPG